MNDFLLTDEERRLRRRKRRLIILGATSLALLFGLMFLLARPARNGIKTWQARRHADKAFQLAAQEKWPEARDEAIAAYQLRPNEPAALRAVAHFLSRTGQPQALDFWDRLASRQPLTRDDLRDEAASALLAGDAVRAAAAVKQLLRAGSAAKPGDWLLAAQLAFKQNAPAEAAAALQHLFASPAAARREQFEAAVLELRGFGSGSVDDRQHQADAWERITKLAAGRDQSGLDALVLLGQRALASPNEQTGAASGQPSAGDHHIAEAIESHPLAKAPHQLLAVDLRIRASPNEKAGLIQAAVDRWRTADDKTVVTLATWLNGRGEHQRELEAIPLERALHSRELFLQHVDALGGLGRWEEIRHLLESERFPLEPVVQQMYLARCYAQLGQKVASENSWKRALESAAGDTARAMSLGSYAEKNGALDIAETAFAEVTRTAPGARAAWQGRLRVAQASRDTSRIHGLLALMLQRWPNDTALQNDEAYLRLLLFLPNESASSSSLPTIEALAEELVRREPASLPHRTLLALARLRQHRPYTALEAYQNIQVPAHAAAPSALAVHAAVLAATGATEAAQTEAGQINRAALLPEERALIEKP